MEKQCQGPSGRRSRWAAAVLMFPMALTPMALTPMTASPYDAGPILVDEEAECPTYWGPVAGTGGVITPETTLTLDVLVLLDGPGRDEAEELLAPAAGAYAPLGIHLHLTEWRRLLPVDEYGRPIEDRHAADQRTPEALMDRARRQLGGRVPAAFDVVYILTDVNLGRDGRDTLVGSSACVGGIVHPTLSFAVGEVVEPSATDYFTFGHEISAKIFGHEVGHLMGGSHTYPECGPQATNELDDQGIAACGLMVMDIGLATLDFGAVNGGAVRALAEDHLD